MEIFRKEIPKSVLDNIKTQIADYLDKNNLEGNKYRANMDNVAGLYVENLVEQRGSKMVQRPARNGKPQEIAVDKQFCEFNSKKEPIKFKDGMAKLINSQLGHELLHAASRSNDCIGLIIQKDRSKEAINEGFTQSITEDIFGYTVSPVTDSYNELKKFAKILTKTFGNKVCLNSYFEHTDDLKNACNNFAGDNSYYDDISNIMHLMYPRTLNKSKDFVSEELDKEIYNEARDLAVEKICIKTIVPYMKKLPESEQNEYIANILESVKEDQIFSEKLSNTIKILGTASKTALEKIDNRNSKQFDNLKEKQQLIKEIYNADKIDSIVNISEDGTITLKNNLKIKISNEFLKTKVYSEMFKQNAPESEKTKAQKLLDNILKNPQKDHFTIANRSKAERLQILANLEEQAYAKNVLLMQSTNGEQERIKFDTIKFPKKGQNLDFEDLKKIHERYTIDYKEDNYSNNNMFIKDRQSGKEINAGFVYDMAMFASVWVEAAGTKWMRDEKNKGETYAFNDSSKDIYEELMLSIKESLNKTGVIDTPTIFAQISDSKYKYGKTIVDKLFGNKTKLNIVNRFVKRIDPSIGLEVEIAENSQNFRGIEDSEIIKYNATDIVKEITRFTDKTKGTKSSDIQAQIDKLKELMKEPEKSELLEIK